MVGREQRYVDQAGLGVDGTSIGSDATADVSTRTMSSGNPIPGTVPPRQPISNRHTLRRTMRDKIREFVLEALGVMNYDVSDVSGDTDLGPAGLDLESLALADLAVQVEDEYKIKFSLDDMESTAMMTLDEFTAEVVARISALTAGSAP
jgi:acyl carrier protein